MNTHKGYRIFSTLVCLTLMLGLTMGNVSAGPTLQSETDFATIDAYVAEQMKNLGIPGMALGIVQDGQIAHVQGFGVADSAGRAVTPQTPFLLGSVTKSFTALAVMQLVEAGQISLDAPVQTYLPWFELADKEASAKITVRHLLNQTTGISTRDGMRMYTSRQGLEGYIRDFATVRLAQPVGSVFQYSNVNYGIAGLIVEKVSGQLYADYVTEHIFEPLDMRHSFASSPLALADGLAEGHHFMFGAVFRDNDEESRPPAGLPSGGLMISAEDLSHYAMAQLKEGRYGEVSILSPQGIAELHAPAVSTVGSQHYGMGWFVDTSDGMQVIFHQGDTSRSQSALILVPERNLSIILLANVSGFVQLGSNPVQSIVLGVLDLLTGKPASPVPQPVMMSFLYWAILLVPLLQVLGIVIVWRRRQRMPVWGVVLTVILNLAVVAMMISLSQSSMPLLSLVVFFPEMGYASIVVAALGVGWSVLYTAMSLRTRRTK